MNRNKTGIDHLLAILHDAEIACSHGDYVQAEILYTNAIEIDRCNPALYGNRSAVHYYLKNLTSAVNDAEKAIKIEPTYSKGYYRLGIAHQYLHHHKKALVVFAKAMALDSKNHEFLQALIETALQSSLRDSLNPVMLQLREMGLERNPFVVVSVIGQDLLSHGDAEAAIEVLECAITIGTSSLKLKASVFSALSSALWTLEQYERAISYMKEDLRVSQALNDVHGECRAYGNLAAAFFHQEQLQDALNNHQHQLLLAEQLQHQQLMANAHSGLGMVYGGLEDCQTALHHHRRAEELFGAVQDNIMRSKELGRIAQCQCELGHQQEALESLKKRLQICDEKVEEAQAHIDIATVYKEMKDHDEERSSLLRAASIFNLLDDVNNETKVLLSLGYSARTQDDIYTALSAYERVREIAEQSDDKPLEVRACANLGIVHHQAGDYEMALKLQTTTLSIATEIGDLGSQGRAHGNIGNAYSASGMYQLAVDHHLKELDISRSIGDVECECSTHGNLAVTYQSLQMQEEAMSHYKSQYELACEIGNDLNKARSLMNMANYYNTIAQYSEAVEYYREYLATTNAVPQLPGVGRALYNLGFALFSLRNYAEAVTCYERSVAVATDAKDKVAMARAYCNLGLTQKAQGDLDAAFASQSTFLDLSIELESSRGRFKALANLGELCVAKSDFSRAAGFYERQLLLSEELADRSFVAQSCASLSAVYRSLKRHNDAVSLLVRECEIYRELEESKNEYRSQGRLGAAFTALGDYSKAMICYNRQLELSCGEDEMLSRVHAWRSLAITHVNVNDYVNAKESFENEIEVLELLTSASSRVETCRAYCSVADCCLAIEDYGKGLNYAQIALQVACEVANLSLIGRACKLLSNCLLQLGDFDAAVTFAEHRLSVSKVNGKAEPISSAFADLGYLYSQVKRCNDALHCLEEQMRIAVETRDDLMKGDAACGLGGVYLLMEEYDKALTFHKLDLELAQRNDDRPSQGRAYGNIATVHEAQGDFLSAVPCREQHLFIAKEQNDEEAKLIALHGIGSDTLKLPDGDLPRSVLLLQQAVLCHGDNENKEVASAMYDLAVGTWAGGDLLVAISHFKKATAISESICFRAYNSMKDGGAVRDVIESCKLLAKSYSGLLCAHGCHGDAEAAIEVAEKSRTFVERLLSTPTKQPIRAHVTIDDMMEYVTNRNSAVIYYAITAQHLYQWFLSPESGIKLAGVANLSMDATSPSEVFCMVLSELQNALGVACNDDANGVVPEHSGSDDPLLYEQLLSIFSSFQYSTSHLTTGRGCLINKEPFKRKKTPVLTLYDLLLSKLEKDLNLLPLHFDLTIIADNHLLVVPFPMLKKRPTDRYLIQNFTSTLLPSFQHALRRRPTCPCAEQCVAVSLISPQDSADASWTNHAAPDEASSVASLFRTEPVLVAHDKSVVLRKLGASEVLLLSCAMVWGKGVLCGSLNLSGSSNQSPDHSADIFLTPADILSSDLSATKLVVLGAPFLVKSDGEMLKRDTISRIVSFIKCLFAAGVHSVLFPLWPIPETASRILLQTFFTQLSQGRSSNASFSVAIETLRNNPQFEHPSYWAGYALVGQEIKLASPGKGLGAALSELVRGRPSLVRDAIKLLTHLIDTSLDSDVIDQVPTFTSQASVSSRVGNTRGWKQLFTAAGFEMRPSSGKIPDAIFFPPLKDKNAKEELMQDLAPFQAATDQLLRSIGLLTSSPSAARSLAEWIDDVIQRHHDASGDSAPQMKRYLFETDGVSMLISSLGFHVEKYSDDLVWFSGERSTDVGTMQCAFICLKLLFGSNADESIRDDFRIYMHDVEGVNTFYFSALISRILSEHDVASPNSSSRSVDGNGFFALSEDGSGNVCRALPFEEPKNFTQIPKTPGLIAPKPLLPQKSLSSAENESSSAGAVTPSNLLQHPLGSTFSPVEAAGSPQEAWNFRAPSPNLSLSMLPRDLPLTSHKLSPSSRGAAEPKVCVVSPQREPSQTSVASLSRPLNRFISVFESMLAKDISGDIEGESSTKDISPPHVVPPGSSYKPSPSAASSLRTTPPQHECTSVMNNLTHRAPSEHGETRKSREQRTRSSTHTAYRLVNRHNTIGPPKLQKYLVETQISTVHTLLSEDQPSVASNDITAPPPKSPPHVSPRIFRRLGAVNLKENRAKFV